MIYLKESLIHFSLCFFFRKMQHSVCLTPVFCSEMNDDEEVKHVADEKKRENESKEGDQETECKLNGDSAENWVDADEKQDENEELDGTEEEEEQEEVEENIVSV